MQATNPRKITDWVGANKTRSRLLKLHEVNRFIRSEGDAYGRDNQWEPACLTFAGPSARFERMLVNGNITSPDSIFTIQTYQRLGEHHFGKTLLDKLIKTRRKYLRGMHIWPHNFHTFSKCYTLAGCKKPSNSTQALWNKAPYKRYMQDVLKTNPVRFSILDLDFCGIFNEKNSQSVVNLFSNKLLEPSGVAFINHQKGRDVRGGKLFDILHGYLKTCPFIDFDSIPNIHEEREGWPTYLARYVLIPLYYMCKAAEHGYILILKRLAEYRDWHGSSGGAVNMLQYYFNWWAQDIVHNHEDYLRKSLEAVIGEEYMYHHWVQ